MCCSILKATDAGPGVGVTNTEVHFRDTELHGFIHLIVLTESIVLQVTLHRTKQKVGINADIGDALVDGTALKWEYLKPFDDLPNEEIDELSASEVKERER